LNFKKLCNDFLKLDPKIRFVGVLNSKGAIIAHKIRDDSISLLSKDELNMVVYYTTDRWNRLQNLEHKLGKVKETITKYDNANTITLFFDKNLFLISTDPNSNNSKIASGLWKIILNNTIKKSPAKKKSKSRVVKKDNLAKLKPRLNKLEERVNSLYQKHRK